MITKTYHVITIDITQIIDTALNPNLFFPILKKVHQIGLKWSEMDQIDQSGPNWIEYT